MIDVLISIFLTTPSNRSQSNSKIWLNVLGALEIASSLEQGRKTFNKDVGGDPLMPIFQSPSLIVDTSMLGAP
ncbi:hypothetical protein AGABI1DRAFT_112901, partial [Agaricus bisporus var. burnettii JB137-S8]